MSDPEKPQVIVIKRITKKGGHHGGGWKIAYADFMTAMMAFFMLLWMLSMMNKFQLQGISNYFKKPMKELFLENQLHNSRIPKVITDHTEAYELAQSKQKKDGHALRKDTNIHNRKLEPDSIPQPAPSSKQDRPKTPKPQKAAMASSSAQSPTNDAGKIEGKSESSITKETEKPSATSTHPTTQQTQKDAKTNNQYSMPAAERAALEKIKSQLEASLRSQPELNKNADIINFSVVNDGLKINISSLKDKPMFSRGKTDFSSYASDIIKWVTEELNKTPRKITIIGHTDTTPYGKDAQYTNWELSADRANATRRYLIKNGMPEDKIMRVQGSGTTNLLFKKDGTHPANRRIEIIILTDDAVRRMENQ